MQIAFDISMIILLPAAYDHHIEKLYTVYFPKCDHISSDHLNSINRLIL